MPALNNIKAQLLCDANQNLLRENELEELINDDGFLDLSTLNFQQQKELEGQIIKNEKFNVEVSKENFQKIKYKAKNISEVLILALALLVAGLALAPLFIASSLILPVLPVLFFGVAIIALTKLYFIKKTNNFKTIAQNADKALNQLMEYKEVAGNGEEIINALHNEIQEISNIARGVNSKVDMLEEKTTHHFTQLFAKFGKFPTSPISIPVSDSANEVHSKETISLSPTHN